MVVTRISGSSIIISAGSMNSTIAVEMIAPRPTSTPSWPTMSTLDRAPNVSPPTARIEAEVRIAGVARAMAARTASLARISRLASRYLAVKRMA